VLSFFIPDVDKTVNVMWYVPSKSKTFLWNVDVVTDHSNPAFGIYKDLCTGLGGPRIGQFPKPHKCADPLEPTSITGFGTGFYLSGKMLRSGDLKVTLEVDFYETKPGEEPVPVEPVPVEPVPVKT